MKISLIHPSRGRAGKAFETYLTWINLISFDNKIEHILSIDLSDSDLENYKLLPFSKVIINDNKNVVEATNIAAKEATGDILVYLSDDFKCPQNWDELIISFFENNEMPTLLKVDDCLQKFSSELITMPIMNRKLYEILGYFWNPLYEGSFVDNDLYHTCKKYIFNAPELKFEHLHYSIGKALHDETYKRQDNNFESGKLIFQKRKSLNFPI